jgi:hypothetical protein
MTAPTFEAIEAVRVSELKSLSYQSGDGVIVSVDIGRNRPAFEVEDALRQFAREIENQITALAKARMEGA